jgi:hypothetical protein
MAHGGADGGDGWHNTLEGGRKWPELLHMAEKHIIFFFFFFFKKRKKKKKRRKIGRRGGGD